MFSSVIISPDPAWRHIVHELAAESKMMLIHRICDGFPHSYELVRMIHTISPDIVFIDVTQPEKAVPCANKIRAEQPRVVIIGFGGDALNPLPPTDHGIVEVLPTPLDSVLFNRVVEASFRKVHAAVLDNLLVFLPAKAGGGASTVALNTGYFLSKAYQKKVLVIEADLRSGVMSVFLNCTPEGSMQDLLKATSEIDSFKLEQCLTRKLGMDLLLSNNTFGGKLPAWNHYFQVLEFVRGRYDWILVDLPELVNPATAEVVRRAQSVFTVCTQEIPSLKLAQKRCQDLKDRGVPAERARVVLNRWHRSEIAATDIERLLAAPIQAIIPNDYAAFRSALVEGRCVPQNSGPGRAYLQFAGTLVEEPPSGPQRPLFADQILNLFRKSRPTVDATP